MMEDHNLPFSLQSVIVKCGKSRFDLNAHERAILSFFWKTLNSKLSAEILESTYGDDSFSWWRHFLCKQN